MNNSRHSPVEMSKDQFKEIGKKLIDDIAGFYDGIRDRPVTPGETPEQLQLLLKDFLFANDGRDAKALIGQAAKLLFDHSLLNGHPRFLGYITSSPTAIGALADLLASAVNPNVGANILSPIATEIEKQTIKWLAEFLGLSPDWGGILVSGGNMANFTAFLAARTAKAPKSIKQDGISNSEMKLLVYCSKATHTWIEKAAFLFGFGTKAIRWIETDQANRMDNLLLEQTIRKDLENGYHPVMVVGTAGDVSTGVVDDLQGIALVCRKFDLWFHIDGAYGAPAVIIPEYKSMFEGMEEADSIAIDPHKWLYSPLEAGCTLVKNENYLIETYSSHPVYYNFGSDDDLRTKNFYEYGFQNSRGFRALKVWLALQMVGRDGYIEMIRGDIHLAELFFDLATKHSELEAISINLSIATLRYIPSGFDGEKHDAYLNTLNEALLNLLQKKGEVFLSNAVIRGKYCLRGCIVNFRTSPRDIELIVEIIVREGRKLHRKLTDDSDVSV